MIWLVLAIALAVRTYPRLRLPDAYLSDTYFHLYCARVIRHQGLSLPVQLPRVLLPHRYTYPFAYHFFLAALPPRAVPAAERLTGPICDTASVFVAFLFCRWLQRTGLLAAGTSVEWTVAGLMAVSPALLRVGVGPRAYTGSPRVIGQTLYLVHLVCACIALHDRTALPVVASVMSAALIFITAKFAVQVLVFFAPVMCLALSPLYLALPVAGLLVAVIATGGAALPVLAGQYAHSLFYARHLQSSYLESHTRSFRDYASAALGATSALVRNGDFARFRKWFLTERHPLHSLLTAFPPFLTVPMLLAGDLVTAPLRSFVVAWTMCAVLCFLLTSRRRLLFLGESDRYLEYATFPSLLATVVVLSGAGHWALVGFAFYSAAYALASMALFVTLFSPAAERARESTAAYAAADAGRSGAILPIGPYHWEALFRSSRPVVTIGGNIDARLLSPEEFDRVYSRYPYPSADFDGLVDRLGVAFVVTDPPHAEYYSARIVPRPQDFYQRLRPVHTSERMLVFEVTPREEGVAQDRGL